MSFTSGPWVFRWEEDGDEEGGYGTDVWHGDIITAPWAGNPDGEDICQVWPRDEANGHLICAAPDMYVVLTIGQQMRAAQKEYFKSRTQQALQNALAYEKDFDRITKEVLAKARGEAVAKGGDA